MKLADPRLNDYAQRAIARPPLIVIGIVRHTIQRSYQSHRPQMHYSALGASAVILYRFADDRDSGNHIMSMTADGQAVFSVDETWWSDTKQNLIDAGYDPRVIDMPEPIDLDKEFPLDDEAKEAIEQMHDEPLDSDKELVRLATEELQNAQNRLAESHL